MIKKVVAMISVLTTLLAGFGLNNNRASLYQDIFSNSDYLELYAQSMSEVRGVYAYITDDDVPELLIADGDYEAARVSVFTMENGKIIRFIGTFGSPCGTLKYCEKDSYIESVYGNHGSSYNIFTNLDEGITVIGDVFILQRLDLPTKYNADFYPDGMTGDNSFDYLLYSVPEETEVGEAEYYKRYEELRNYTGGEWKSVEYETMYNLNELIGKVK